MSSLLEMYGSTIGRTSLGTWAAKGMRVIVVRIRSSRSK